MTSGPIGLNCCVVNRDERDRDSVAGLTGGRRTPGSPARHSVRQLAGLVTGLHRHGANHGPGPVTLNHTTLLVR